jgi:hypothetical protein
MIEEVCIVVLAVCCVFSLIPLIYLGPLGLLSLLFLGIVLVYASNHAKILLENKKYRLLQFFILSLIVSTVLSFIILRLLFPLSLQQ